MKNLISAVIPLGNYEPHLSKIETLFEFTDFIELIFVCDLTENNGSDKFRNLLNNFPTGVATLIEGEFGSPGRARNAGKENVKSNWITFWDCDDLPKVEAVLRFVEKLENSKEIFDVGIAQFEVLDEPSSEILKRTAQTKLFELPLNPGLWRMIVRTEKQESIKFEEVAMGEDQLFILDLQLRKESVFFSSEITYVYCRHLFGQLTRTETSLKELDICIRLTSDRLFNVNLRDKPLTFAFLIKQLFTKARLTFNASKNG
jgi:glycosyltransferase involved in cell wall biosynthesis